MDWTLTLRQQYFVATDDEHAVLTYRNPADGNMLMVSVPLHAPATELAKALVALAVKISPSAAA